MLFGDGGFINGFVWLRGFGDDGREGRVVNVFLVCGVSEETVEREMECWR